MGSRPERLRPLTITDYYLADLLDEVRAIRRHLVQEPQEPTGERAGLVTEPAPDRQVDS